MANQVWLPLAANFPAGLDTETEPSKLADGFTPAAYGMDIDHPGYLAKGTAPTGTARIAKTFTISTTDYNWYYQRLWLKSGATLKYGFPEYQTVYLPHDIPLGFEEDANSLITFFPFAGSAMFVAKSTGGYMIPNAASRGGAFTHSDIQPAMAVATDGYATELDGVAYASNANGLFAWDGQQVVEVTRNVRNILTGRFASMTLYRDENKRRIVCRTGTPDLATKAVYDPTAKKLFDYSTSGFLFTSRTFVDSTAERSVKVDMIGIAFENTTETDGTMTMQVKRDEDWEDSFDTEIRFTPDHKAFVQIPLPTNYAARQFTMRITDMPMHVRIQRIGIRGDLTVSREGWSQ